MVVSTMNIILCRSWLSVYFISLFLFYPSYVNGEESTCKLQSTGNCDNAIVVTIDEKSAKEKIWFNLYYYPVGKKEIVAVLNYDKSYSCHPTNGYTCTKTTDVTFNITLGCETLQNVTLVGDGQQPVTCIPMESSPVESTNINNHNCSACANDTAPGNSVSHSRRKRCACPNGLPGPSADTGKPGNTGGEGGISNGHEQNESRFPIGHSIIILILIMNAVTGVVFLSLKQTKLCKSWKQNRKRRAKERTRLSKLEDTEQEGVLSKVSIQVNEDVRVKRNRSTQVNSCKLILVDSTARI